MANSNFTSTTSSLIAGTRNGRDRVTIWNDGPGALYVLEEADDNATPTVSSTNCSCPVESKTLYESTDGFCGRLFGVFSSAGTARVNVFPRY